MFYAFMVTSTSQVELLIDGSSIPEICYEMVNLIVCVTHLSNVYSYSLHKY